MQLSPKKKTGNVLIFNRKVDHDKSSGITNINNTGSIGSNEIKCGTKENYKKYLKYKYEQTEGLESEVEELREIIENYRESEIVKEANRIGKRIEEAIKTEKGKIKKNTKSVEEPIKFVKKIKKKIENLKVKERIKDM